MDFLAKELFCVYDHTLRTVICADFVLDKVAKKLAVTKMLGERVDLKKGER